MVFMYQERKSNLSILAKARIPFYEGTMPIQGEIP